jgi:glycyl-tRNA synthetase
MTAVPSADATAGRTRSAHPFAITVDYDTKENNTVTLRDRDSMKQVRIAIDKLPETVSALIEGNITFASLE